LLFVPIPIPAESILQEKFLSFEKAINLISHLEHFQLRWVYSNPFHSASEPADQRALWAGYYAGVYDPVNHQIVFVPWKQAPWHRYDCASQTIEAYENPFHLASEPAGERIVFDAYNGGLKRDSNTCSSCVFEEDIFCEQISPVSVFKAT
jgi:hypothetical protein